MSLFLANENVPQAAIDMARVAGIDVAWVKEISPGDDDDQVLARSLSLRRVLITFDKDFGELTFRRGDSASCGIILMRPRLRSPQHVANFVLNVLSQNVTWEGHFSVAQEGQIRIIPLPGR